MKIFLTITFSIFLTLSFCGSDSNNSHNSDIFESTDLGNYEQQVFLEDTFFTETSESTITDQHSLDTISQFESIDHYDSSTDEPYWEPLDEKKDLSDLISNYSQSNWYETLTELLKQRYTTGQYIVLAVTNPKQQASSFTDTSTIQKLIMSLSTVVHELNHAYDFEHWGYSTYTVLIRHDLEMKVPYFSTFPRGDIFQYITWSDYYAEAYLTGEMGKQGFDTLIDELNAYTQSLFTDYSFVDQYPKNMSMSSRDGLLTFMIYTELYLMHGRLHSQTTYNKITSSDKWRDLIITLWDRADFILNITDSYPQLGIYDDLLYSKVYDEDYLQEIEIIKQMD